MRPAALHVSIICQCMQAPLRKFDMMHTLKQLSSIQSSNTTAGHGRDMC